MFRLDIFFGFTLFCVFLHSVILAPTEEPVTVVTSSGINNNSGWGTTGSGKNTKFTVPIVPTGTTDKNDIWKIITSQGISEYAKTHYNPNLKVEVRVLPARKSVDSFQLKARLNVWSNSTKAGFNDTGQNSTVKGVEQASKFVYFYFLLIIMTVLFTSHETVFFGLDGIISEILR